jgi:hypothetical protein
LLALPFVAARHPLSWIYEDTEIGVEEGKHINKYDDHTGERCLGPLGCSVLLETEVKGVYVRIKMKMIPA